MYEIDYSNMNCNHPKLQKKEMSITIRMDEKLWHSQRNIHTMKMNQLLLHATAQTNLTNILVAKKSQTPETSHYDSIYIKF